MSYECEPLPEPRLPEADDARWLRDHADLLRKAIDGIDEVRASWLWHYRTELPGPTRGELELIADIARRLDQAALDADDAYSHADGRESDE